MTSSEKTTFDPGAPARYAGRVAQSIEGDASRAPARIAFVCAKFNGAITLRLLEGGLACLVEHGVDESTVTVAWVPGAFEVPCAAKALASSGRFDAVVALGAVIRGDTPHFDFVAGECASGLARVALDTGVPVVFGVLTTDDVDQALERSGAGAQNKGAESAFTALEMADLLSRLDTSVSAGARAGRD